MSGEELVEAVARAMRDDYCRPGRPALAWDDPELPEAARESWREPARAAIRAVYAAMREPSAEMQKQGDNALCMWIAPAMHAADAWRAMLAASPLAEAARDE